MRRILAIAVAALLLVASAIPSLWRMDCLSSGRVKVSWIDIKPCCHEEDARSGPAVKVLCCVYSHVQAALSDQRPGNGDDMPSAQGSPMPHPATITVLPPVYGRSVPVVERPPPLLDRPVTFRSLLI